jgi:hypothetical protein
MVYLVAFALAAFAVGLILFEYFFATAMPGRALENGTLSNAQIKAIDTTMDLAKTFTTWAVAVIGATAFFLKLNFEKDVKITIIDLAYSSAIFLLCITSIAFWQIATDLTAQLLAAEQFPLESDRLHRLLRYEYVAGLAAICLFGVYVFHFFWARIRKSS